MPTCPFCHADLPESDLRSQRCSRCGEPLSAELAPQPPVSDEESASEPPESEPPESEPPGKSDTADKEEMGETLDGAALPEPPPSEEDADTADDFPEDRTLGAAGPSETPPAEDLIGESDDDHFAETIDSGQVPPPASKEGSAIPAVSLPSDANPLSSIKAEFHTGVAESKLVIPPRVVCRRDEPAAAAADYEVLDKIGTGGMGVVYSARQASIGRQVALKMLRPDRGDDKGHRASLLTEAVITGDLEHPNIVPIYDLGVNAKGELFYSMKHVRGTEWDDVISSRNEAEDLDALLKVSDAVAFAHSRNVIHRDLKPRNIMLGDFGEVLVMDWGLAMSPGTKGDDRIEGTPAYMAPEMARGDLGQVGFHSDVYLLGAILYEIITGDPPHEGKTANQCVAVAAKNEIKATDRTGELLDVALKAMAAAPEDRYADVGEFQLAVRQYQAHSQSVLLTTRAREDLDEAEREKDYKVFAQSLFGFQEALKLWEDNAAARSGVSQAAKAYAGCALGRGDFDLGISLLDNLDRRDPERKKLQQRLQSGARDRDRQENFRRNAKRIGVALVATIFVVITVSFFWVLRAEGIAQTQKEIAVQEKKEAERQKGIAEGQTKEAKRQEGIAIKQKANAIAQKKEADRQRANAESNEKKAQYSAYVTRIGLAEASIGDNAFDRARNLLLECPGALRNWEWHRLDYLCTQSETEADAGKPIEAVAFSPDGKRFATGGWGGTVRVWDAETGKPVEEPIETGADYVFALAFSADGTRLAIGTNDQPNYLKIRDLQEDKTLQLPGHANAIVSVVYSRSGQKLLTSSYDGTAKLWDLTSGKVVQSLQGHDWWVWSAAFDPGEKRIVTASQDGTVIVWDAATGKPATPPFRGHAGPVYQAVFSPDGRRVASAGYDKRVLLWDPEKVEKFDVATLLDDTKDNPPPEYTALAGHTAAVRSVQFSPDGGLLISGGNDNTVKIWDADSGRLQKNLRGHGGRVLQCLFSPKFSGGNRRVLSGSHDHFAKIWNLDDYEESRTFGRRVLAGHEDAVLGAAFSPDGQEIVTASRDRTARKWNRRTGKEIHKFREGHAYLTSTAALFPDGKRLLTAAVDNTARIWDVTGGGQELVLPGTGTSTAVALSSDGQWILTGSDKKDPDAKLWDAKLWDARSGQIIDTLEGHGAEVTAVAISGDRKLLFTGDALGRCRLWNAETRQQIWLAADHTAAVTAAAFLPDASRIVTASLDNSVAQWDAATGKELPKLRLKHGYGVTSMALSRDGRRLLTACRDKSVEVQVRQRDRVQKAGRLVSTVRLWDVATGRQIGELDTRGEIVSTVAFSPDGQRAVTTCADEFPQGEDGRRTVAQDPATSVRLWDVSTQREIPAAGGGAFLAHRNVRNWAWSAVFSGDGRYIVTAGGDKASLWNLATGTREMDFGPHQPVASAHFSPDGRSVITGSWDTTARIWNAATGLMEQKLQGGHEAFVNSAVFHPTDPTLALTASDDGTAKLWKLEGEQPNRKWKVFKEFIGHTGDVNGAVFSPDGEYVLTASNDKTARIWNAKDGKELPFSPLRENDEEVRRPDVEAEFTHQQAVLCAVYSADGKWIVTGSEDTTARLWRADTGRPVMIGDLATEEATDPAAADPPADPADDEPTDPADDEPTVPQKPLILAGHSASVTSVAVSEDGTRALTGSADGTAKLWELRNGDEILTLKGHTEEVTCVAFSPDTPDAPGGVSILTGSRDGTLMLWPTRKATPQAPSDPE